MRAGLEYKENVMRVELLVSEWCQSCHQAEKVWRQVAEEKAIDFAVVDMGQPEGKELVSRLRLKTIPALVIDGDLKGIGVQTLGEARQWVAGAADKGKTAVQHAGLSLSLDNRVFVISAMVYLLLAGLSLLVQGALLGDGVLRLPFLHLFTIGFMLMLTYGVGAHMLPRFMGQPIRGGAWSWTQLGLAHGGLLLLVTGFVLSPHIGVVGGALVWLSLLLFIVRLWPVLWPAQLPAVNGVVKMARPQQ